MKLPKELWVSLLEAVWLLIEWGGEPAIANELRQREHNGAFVLYGPEHLKAAEEKAEIALRGLLRPGKIEGKANPHTGDRREITEEEWASCDISVSKGAVLATGCHLHALNGVRIRADDLLREYKAALAATGTAPTSAEPRTPSKPDAIAALLRKYYPNGPPPARNPEILHRMQSDPAAAPIAGLSLTSLRRARDIVWPRNPPPNRAK